MLSWSIPLADTESPCHGDLSGGERAMVDAYKLGRGAFFFFNVK